MEQNFDKIEIMKGFLLGDLVEEERSAFEDEFLSDQKLFDELKVVEDELVESYVRGWMGEAERSKFEANYLETGSGQKKLKAFRAFQQKIGERKTAMTSKASIEKPESESIWTKLSEFFLTPQFVGGFAILFLAIIGWFVYQNVGGENREIAKEGNANFIESPTPTPDLPVNVETNAVNSDMPENVAVNKNVTIKKPTPTATPVKTPAATPKKTPEKVETVPNPVLALFPGTLRSGGTTGQVTLPNGAKNLRLQLRLTNADYKTYVVEVTDANGASIYRSGKLKPGGKTIAIKVPAEKLKRGDYLVKLSGLNEKGENESVADYQFRVKQ